LTLLPTIAASALSRALVVLVATRRHRLGLAVAIRAMTSWRA
jgi:hypothetical protein